MIIDAHAACEFAIDNKMITKLNEANVDKVILYTSLKNTTNLSNPPKIYSTQKEKFNHYDANKFIRTTYHLLRDKADGNLLAQKMVEKYPDHIIHFNWVNPIILLSIQ